MSKSVLEINLTGDLDGKLVKLTGKIADFEKEVSDFLMKILEFNQAA